MKINGASEASFGISLALPATSTQATPMLVMAARYSTTLMSFEASGKYYHPTVSTSTQPPDPSFLNSAMFQKDLHGERRRRFDEASVTEEQAEAACAGLEDEFSRKGCIYNIIATPRLGMVGAYWTGNCANK